MTQSQTRKFKPNVEYKQLDLYDYYQALHPDTDINYKQYTEVLQSFNTAIMDDILKGKDFNMPFYLGKLSIRKKENIITEDKKFLKVDFQATKRAGKTMYHLNEHSGNKYARFMWNKGELINKTFYTFKATRIYRRAIAAVMKSGKHNIYLDA